VVASAPAVEAAAEPEPEPGPVGEGEQAAEVRDVLEHIVRAVGVRARIEIVEGEEAVTATLVGPELGLLIGKHGQTIDAMQYLANAAVWRGRGDERKAVVVDAAGYRARREATLASLAQRSAERAVSSARSVELDPMTAVERKVVHVCLKEYPGVVTRSEGTEPNRFVVIDPV
jgi:spoIIIJ-associated protein